MIEAAIDKKINDLMKEQLEPVHIKHTRLEEENSHLRSRLSQLDVEARLNNLVLHGVEELDPMPKTRQEAEKEAIGATLAYVPKLWD